MYCNYFGLPKIKVLLSKLQNRKSERGKISLLLPYFGDQSILNAKLRSRISKFQSQRISNVFEKSFLNLNVFNDALSNIDDSDIDDLGD